MAIRSKSLPKGKTKKDESKKERISSPKTPSRRKRWRSDLKNVAKNQVA
jgi:hypothetical protein